MKAAAFVSLLQQQLLINKSAAVAETAALCGVGVSAVYYWLAGSRATPKSAERLFSAWHMLTPEQRKKITEE